MVKLNLPSAYETEIYRCVRCGFCTPTCPIFEAKGIESWNCRGRLIIEKELILGNLEVTPDVLDRLYTCTLCKVCETNCPAKIQVVAIQEHVREELVKQGLGPLNVHKEVRDRILQKDNIAGLSPNLLEKPFGSLIENLPSQSATLLFSGCVGTFNYPDITQNALQLLQQANLDFTMFKTGEICCSGILKIVGCTDEFEAMAQKNISLFEKREINRIITACPMCFGIFQQDYPKISKNVPQVIHLVQALEEQIDRDKINLKRPIDVKAVVYEGCHLGRYSNLYDPPRKVLEVIPKLKLMELPRSRDQVPCCGGTIRDPYNELRDHLSDNIIAQAEKIGADMVVTMCPTCYHNIRSAGLIQDIEVVNITTAVAYSSGLIDSFHY